MIAPPLSENQTVSLKLKHVALLEFSSKEAFISSIINIRDHYSAAPESILAMLNHILGEYARMYPTCTHYQQVRFDSIVASIKTLAKPGFPALPHGFRSYMTTIWAREISSWLFGFAAVGEEMNQVVIDGMMKFNAAQYEHFGDKK